jgi:hypothetical protein
VVGTVSEANAALEAYWLENIEKLSKEHSYIEWELIDLSAEVLAGTATPIQVMRLLDLWFKRHNPLELEIILAYARLPKPLREKLRSEEGA